MESVQALLQEKKFIYCIYTSIQERFVIKRVFTVIFIVLPIKWQNFPLQNEISLLYKPKRWYNFHIMKIVYVYNKAFTIRICC